MTAADPGGDGDARLLLKATRLVARDLELSALKDALTTPSALAVIEGEAGVGKSRLVHEALAGVEAATTVIALCPPFREPLTLGPVVDAIRHLVTDVRPIRLSSLAGALRPLFPEWSDALPPLPDPAEDATAFRHRVFRALEEVLTSLGVTTVVVEDAHWADEATLEFLLFLTSRPDPLTLVVTYRPEDLPADSLVKHLASRRTRGTTTRISLEPLDVTGTAALISVMLHDEPLSDEFASYVHDRTAGLPFAVEESVRLMHERTDLIRRDRRWERVSLDELNVPATVRDAVEERAARLGESARALLDAAAVLGAPSDTSLLAAVSGLDDAESGAGLAEATASGLLREGERGDVAFVHALAARAVYDTMPSFRRRERHLRAARALETSSPDAVARLARHFREAGDAPSWLRYGERAADQALDAGDEAAAGELLYNLVVHGRFDGAVVLRLVRKVPTGTLSDATRYAGLVGELRRILDRPDDVSGGVAARLRAQLGQLLAVSEHYDEARREIERALPGLHDDPAEAARALTLMGWPVGITQHVSEHRSWLDRAADLADQLDPVDRLTLAVDRVTALLVLGEETGWAEAARIPADTSSTAERPQVTRGHLNVGDMALRWGRYAEARHHLDRALELAERHQYYRYRAGVLVTLVRLDWFTGAWDGLADRAAELAHAADLSPLVRHEAALVEAFLAAVVPGNGDRAAAALEAMADDARAQGVDQHMIEPVAALARLRLAQGHVTDALALTEAPLDVVRRSGIWIWATELVVVGVDALVAAGRTDEAADLVTSFDAWFARRHAPAPQAAAATCHSAVLEARGDSKAAADAFGRAAQMWAALPRPYDSLLATERRGRCLLAAGRTDDGVAVLTGTHADLSELGARADADRLAHLLRDQGIQVRAGGKGGRPAYGDHLSPRELQVLRLVVDGHSNREIGDRLFLSPWTVRHHVNAAKRKLRADTRAALAVAAIGAGFVADSPGGRVD